MKLNKLSGRMKTWFNESNHKALQSDDFNFRFRGQESYGLLKFFPKLILE